MTKERGSALVNALIFIAALAILGLSLSHLATSRLRSSQQRIERAKAEAAAESGMEEAICRLQQEPGWYADGSDSRPLVVRELPDWRYELRVIPNSDGISYQVQSMGTVGAASKTADRIVITTMPTRYALYAMEKLDLHTSGTISGMVYAGKEFNGTLPDGARLDTYPAPMHRAELPKLADYLTRRPDRIIEGYLRDYRVENRFLFKAGTLTLDQGVLNKVSWLADGTITVQGRTTATAKDGLPLFFADGDMLLNLAPGSQLAGVIICRGTCIITGSGDISGSVIAKNIDCGGTVNISPMADKVSLPGVAQMWWLL